MLLSSPFSSYLEGPKSYSIYKNDSDIGGNKINDGALNFLSITTTVAQEEKMILVGGETQTQDFFFPFRNELNKINLVYAPKGKTKQAKKLNDPST